MEKIIREILGQVKPDMGMEEIGADLALEDAGLDSLDQASILLAIQERFGIQITDEEAAGLTNISSIAKYLDSKGQSA